MEPLGELVDGAELTRFTLGHIDGPHVGLLNLGATLTELWVPDADGVLGDVVLGFDPPLRYRDNEPYFGCTVGRVANRIANGSFELDGVRHQLDLNGGYHHLHGGAEGFSSAVWEWEVLADGESPIVEFRHVSPHGDQGYPGRLEATVRYSFSSDEASDGHLLTIDHRASADHPTPVSLTNHTYWNLAGGGDIRGHELALGAKYLTELGDDLIPTGRLLPVAGTPYDFQTARQIGSGVDELVDEGVVNAGQVPGFDHNYVLAHARARSSGEVAQLADPVSGRRMHLTTTEPGIQLYTANGLGPGIGKRGIPHGPHSGVCLEPQGYPNAVNQPGFPDVILRPPATYRHLTTYRIHTA